MKQRRMIELFVCCAILAANTAQAIPPPPPLEEWAKIVADCRTPASRSIPLTKTTVPVPDAPAELNVGWALRVAPATDAEIGRLMGVTTSWNGSIIAVTDRGYTERGGIGCVERSERIAPLLVPAEIDAEPEMRRAA
ncbi:Putative secreted protein [Sphingopyxis fribergensis]|uniref:Putative secreted protein n=1 Tax=Sphingopyxis fribergensis TaxID=1515612 RepID=A0A0A7PPS7_9SPHN|nr:hypothetical protein [Sphingopyxis fribergensis]AJA11218.1 Putative secreted protein [Sphingopyxis fribergensis]